MNTIYQTKAEALATEQRIRNIATSGYLGIATTTTTPPATGAYWYRVTEAGTYTNFLSGGSPIVVSAADLYDGTKYHDVFIDVKDNVATKRVKAIPTPPVTGVVEAKNTDAVSGGEVYNGIIENNLATNYKYLTPKKENVGLVEFSSNYLWVDKQVKINANTNFIELNLNYAKVNTNRLFVALITLSSSNVFNKIESKELLGDSVGVNTHNLADVFDLESYTEDLYFAFYGVNDNKSVAGKSKTGSQIFNFSNFGADTGTLVVTNNFEMSVYLTTQYKGESLDYRIKEIENATNVKPKLDLPLFFDTYVGGHLQVFKSSIINFFDWQNYYIKVTTDKKSGVFSLGKDYLEYWECFITELGNFNATFTLYNSSGVVMDIKTVGIRIKTKPASLTMPNVMFIGDSLTYYNRLPDEFYRLLTGTTATTTTTDTLAPQTLSLPQGHGYTGVSLKGTKKINFKGWTGQQFHEGYSGYTSLNMISSESPFYIGGSLDFSQYLINNSIGQLDAIFIGLGWNDIVNYSAAESKTYLQTLVNNIRTALPNVKIFVWSENMPSLNGGLGNHPWGSDIRVNLIEWRNKMFEVHTILKELTGVIYVDANAQFQSKNGTQFENYIANFRVRTQEIRGTDDVHPSDAGFFQIADACVKSYLYHN